MTVLPPPLTPPDCVLRDFQFMPMDVQRLLKSETWVLGSGDERAAAMTLWLESWHQVPAGSIPKADKMLAHLSQAHAKWPKVKAHVLRGWVEASDGRLYHAVVAEKVLEAWIEKLSNSLSGASGNAKRWGVDIDTNTIRAQFALAVDMLRIAAPQSKTLKKKIVATFAVASPPDSPPDGDPTSPPDSGGDRNRQGQGQGQGQGLVNPLPPAEADEDATDATPEPVDGAVSTRIGEICIFLRTFGINTSPGALLHPKNGWSANPAATNEILTAAVATARASKPGEAIHVNYLAPIIDRLLAPPKTAPAPPRLQAGKDYL